jgi:hypothetical protein
MPHDGGTVLRGTWYVVWGSRRAASQSEVGNWAAVKCRKLRVLRTFVGQV